MTGVSSTVQRIARIAALAALVISAASPALARQPPRVRVTAERATIWRAGFLTPAALVDRDTVLEVVGRRDNWLEVVLPSTEASPGRQTGFIAITQVATISGALPPSLGASRPTVRADTPARAPGRASPPRVGVRGFADVSYTSFLAHDTFNAVFGTTTGTFAGVGGEVRFNDLIFVQGAFRRYRATGERIVVSDDEVFKLGIEDTLTLTPITVTVGGRFPLRQIVPYVGAGIGIERVQETSEFADPSDNTDERHRTYHVVAGLEWKGRAPVAVAGEVGYSTVPKALAGLVADAFKEYNLGGVDVRVRVLIGR